MKRINNNSQSSNFNKLNVFTLPVIIFILIYFFVGSKDKIDQNNNEIDRIINEEIIYGNLVGLTVSVVKNGNTIHQKSYGFTDLEKKTPFTNSSLFRWASISKVITAVSTHQLIEDGKLNLNDKVIEKVSYWSNDGEKKNITVKQLLSHRSGIRHYEEHDSRKYTGSKTAAWIPRQSVEVFKSGTLVNVPDSVFNYSTFAYNLLGAVVHEVGGGFDGHVNSRIKDVLRLSSLTYNSTNGIKGYDKLCDDILVPRDGSNVISKVPGGGYLSNIQDLNKFMVGLMQGKLLEKTSRLWEENIRQNRGYSLGLVRVFKGNTLFVEHGGAHDDMRTKMIFNTRKEDGIVIAVNGGDYAEPTMNRIIDRIANATGIYSLDVKSHPFHYSFSRNDKQEDVKKGEKLNEPCKGENVAVWHSGDSDVILRKGYSHEAFGDEWQRLSDAGYACVNFETYILNNKRVWDGIFKKQSGKKAMWRNFESNDFNKKWNEMSEQGYRLVDLETYTNGSKRLYAGLFLPGSGKHALYRGFSTKDFGSKREELAKSGYKLIDVEVYYEDKQQKWCGVWIEGQDGLLDRNYKLEQFQGMVDDRKKNGWNLIDIETYKDGKDRLWSGIWEKNNLVQEVEYSFKHDRTFSEKLNSNIINGMVLTSIGKYQ